MAEGERRWVNRTGISSCGLENTHDNLNSSPDPQKSATPWHFLKKQKTKKPLEEKVISFGAVVAVRKIPPHHSVIWKNGKGACQFSSPSGNTLKTEGAGVGASFVASRPANLVSHQTLTGLLKDTCSKAEHVVQAEHLLGDGQSCVEFTRAKEKTLILSQGSPQLNPNFCLHCQDTSPSWRHYEEAEP